MKYKAYQVAPEYQESPLDIDELVNMGGLIVYGNRNYNAHTTPDFDNIIYSLTVGEFDPTSYPDRISIDDMRNLDMLASKFCDSLNPQKIIALALSVWTGNKCYYYTHEWDDTYKTRELASLIGCSVQDLTLYAFDGWERTPKYKEV